jgi:hypothetical protein
VAIEVDVANPVYCSVDGVVFSKDRQTLVAWPAGKAPACVIPNGVTAIGPGAFLGDPILTRVTLPASLTRVGVRAFESCGALAEICLPASVTEIEDYAFTDCGRLQAVYCLGAAPRTGAFPFPAATVYYLPGTGFWDSTLGGRPTVPWDPYLQLSPAIPAAGSRTFDLQITGWGPLPFVVEACVDLANPNWLPVATNAVVNGVASFSDPGWTSGSLRFYRLRGP